MKREIRMISATLRLVRRVPTASRYGDVRFHVSLVLSRYVRLKYDALSRQGSRIVALEHSYHARNGTLDTDTDTG